MGHRLVTTDPPPLGRVPLFLQIFYETATADLLISTTPGYPLEND